MYEKFEGCGHILDDLYDFALENRMDPLVVDSTIDSFYKDHARAYAKIEARACDDSEYSDLLHSLDVHVLEDHVRPDLKDHLRTLEKHGRPDIENRVCISDTLENIAEGVQRR